jgi:hypothetical protein
MAMTNETPGPDLSRTRTLYLVAYNVLITLLLSGFLYGTILRAAHAEFNRQHPGKGMKMIVEKREMRTLVPTASGKDSVIVKTDSTITNADSVKNLPVIETAKTEETPAYPEMIGYVLWAIFLAGGLGGALSNLRGIFEFARDKTYFPAYLEIPFYVRPISGVICGLFTFFVSSFFAGALTQGDASGWQTLNGMFPYIGIAFIAGFASQEFMERLKETAKTLFGVPTQVDVVDPVIPPPPPAEKPQTGGEESFNPNEVEITGDRNIQTTLTPDSGTKVVNTPTTKIRRAD